MKIEKVANLNNIFKERIEPLIFEKLKTNKVIEFPKNELKEILNEKDTSSESLYKRIKIVLENLDLGISRKDDKYVFYKKSDGLKRESDIFKLNFEQKMKPVILDNLNSNLKSEFSIIEIKEIFDIVNIDTIYQRLRSILSETELGLSRKDDKFIFYKKQDGLKHGSDIFKMNFEQKLKPKIKNLLKSQEQVTLTEGFIKEELDIDNITDTLYLKLRNIVDTDLNVSIRRNIVTDDEAIVKKEGKIVNLFDFYETTLVTSPVMDNYEQIENDELFEGETEEIDLTLLDSIPAPPLVELEAPNATKTLQIAGKNSEIAGKTYEMEASNAPKISQTDVETAKVAPKTEEIYELETSDVDEQFLCPNCKVCLIRYGAAQCPKCFESIEWILSAE